MPAHDMCAMFHDLEFQAIPNRNSQLLFLQQYTANKCYISLNDRKLAEIYEISEGHVKQLHCVAREKAIIASRPIDRPRKFDEGQETDMIEMTLAAPTDLKFLWKREIVDEIEN
jgi:hypothetical protein